MYGVRVVVSKHAMVNRWVFPRDPFVEYEAKDEAWCRNLGIGREVIEPGCIRVGGTLYVHPTVFESMKARMP